MAEKKRENIHELSVDELRGRLDDAREELMNLRFQQATGELTDHTRLRFTRRQIARYLTILRQHERMVSAGGTK
jgi:large subunit ribosomal protein L29